ncbi:hypothetical protein [Halorhodospira halophila]|uniref:hypothetical protein n=1 Tax=Halorhodospira halophila TaxID=1053 RepID=UPI00006B51EA|nr:hypothetical protein [Halorhodospira halophila]MBK1730183.1 hypothetical protein [Halorhodospira halophila]
MDALVRNGDGWDLVEVKGATRAKEVFQLDVAIQYWILTGAGIPVRDAGLLLIDRDYVYPGGAHDPQEFFRFEPLTRTCEQWREWIETQVVSFQEVAARTTPPQIEIGQQCFSPYPCPFYNHCSADREWPEHPIEELPYLAGERYQGLLEQGVTTIDAIPDDYPLTGAQKRVRDAVAKGHPWTDPDLGEAVQGVD